MTWIYNGKEINDITQVPEKALGFIYLIRQKSTGKMYIGRKLLSKSSTKSVKGKKKKVRVESDWLSYWSSSPELKAYIKEHGNEDFTREILLFTSSKGMLLYSEELSLYMLGALESDSWINNNIRAKVYRSWVNVKEAIELREKLASIIR